MAIFVFTSRELWERSKTVVPTPRRWYHVFRWYWMRENPPRIVTKHGTFKVKNCSPGGNTYLCVKLP